MLLLSWGISVSVSAGDEPEAVEKQEGADLKVDQKKIGPKVGKAEIHRLLVLERQTFCEMQCLRELLSCLDGVKDDQSNQIENLHDQSGYIESESCLEEKEECLSDCQRLIPYKWHKDGAEEDKGGEYDDADIYY